FTVALDNHGRDTIDAAIELGIAPSRINTIVDRAAAAELGLSADGAAEASAADLLEVARLVASGELVLPIDSVFPLERVREAYEHLMAGHLRGKIVLVTQ
ncbi:MAG: zinc-binding dehydrogenase, partial [Salinibacterium sp.]|nr:zinc-binding dehydrogenase [Salinibacterium sp.]